MEAHLLTQWLEPRLGPALGVTYGVYNLVTRQVGLPALADDAVWTPRLATPPADNAELRALAEGLAGSPWIRSPLR